MQIEELKNQIFCEDCLVGMDKIPDKSIDCIICDLPYSKIPHEWDKLIPFDPLWEQYNRIAKDNAAILLFGVEPFTSAIVMSNVKNYRQKLTWLKNLPTCFQHARKMFMHWTEDIIVFYRKLPTFNPQMEKARNRIDHLKSSNSMLNYLKTDSLKKEYHFNNHGLAYPKTILNFQEHNHRKYYHPTQKPVDLIRYLIRTYTNPGDIVLDNCLGSGTTAIAAMREGRDYIGFEMNQEYFEICERRIADERELMAAQAYPLY